MVSLYIGLLYVLVQIVHLHLKTGSNRLWPYHNSQQFLSLFGCWPTAHMPITERPALGECQWAFLVYWLIRLQGIMNLKTKSCVPQECTRDQISKQDFLLRRLDTPTLACLLPPVHGPWTHLPWRVSSPQSMAPGLSPVGMKDQQAGHTSSPPTILTVIRVGFL
jgi:hypothetical protein